MNDWICTCCSSRFYSGGDCPDCKDEPLLDLADESVRLLLEEEDERTVRNHHYRVVLAFAMVGFLIGIPVWAALYANFPEIEFRTLTAISGIPCLLLTSLGEAVHRRYPANVVLTKELLDPYI